MVSKQAKQKDGEIVSHIQNARTSIRAGKNKAPEKPEGGTVFSSTNNGDPRAPTRVDKLAGDDNPPSFADIVGKAAGGIGGFGGFGGGGGDGLSAQVNTHPKPPGGDAAGPSTPAVQGGLNKRLKRGSLVVADRAAITPQEYLEHVQAVRTAWQYAPLRRSMISALAKRMKKQKKYGHFSIEQWGRTSRVFEKFFWFHSHLYLHYFLQFAVFCTSIYFAVIMNFGEAHVFGAWNFTNQLPQIILLIVCLALVVFLGLFTLVPAILMQYTMVMHLAQLHSNKVVKEAVEAARLLWHTRAAAHQLGVWTVKSQPTVPKRRGSGASASSAASYSDTWAGV